MALDFPANPVDAATFDAPNGVRYTWSAASGVWMVAAPVLIAANRIKFTKFLTVGTGASWTPDANMLFGQAVAKGGGGLSSQINVSPTYIMGAGGGGEGATAIKYFNAGDYKTPQAVTVAAAAGTSSISTWLSAGPGGASDPWAGGAGGTAGVGDWIIPGAPGGGGQYSPGADAVAISGSGGGIGGGKGVYSGTVGGGGLPGAPGAANSGGGGGGSAGRNIGPGVIGGISGGSGYVYVIEYLR